MQSTMQDVPLTLGFLLRHGLANFGTSKVVTCTDGGTREATFAEVGEQAAQLANALTGLGIADGDRVGTFMWNNAEHLVSYLAIPGMGAVLHTLNVRLFPEQLTYIANHAEDRVVIVDGSLVPLLAGVLADMKTVEHVLVLAADDDTLGKLSGKGPQISRYEDVVGGQPTTFDWRTDIDERSAACMCYTSGTTGNPKGVVYSHRSAYLHSMAACMGSAFGVSESDRVLPVVPMFHVNAWGLPYAAWLAGADLLMPDRFLQAEGLCPFIQTTRPTIVAGVPTVWTAVLRYATENKIDVSFLETVVCGGSAVPLSLMKGFQEKLGVKVVQAWGMTETSPLAAIAHPPAGVSGDEEWAYRAKTGRVFAGVECRIVSDDGTVLPADGDAVGEFEVRGPWVTASYYGGDDPDRFSPDGWLRTGDVGTLDALGFMQITDRSKDVIKSGGEWISSVDLENTLMASDDVLEAAVVAVPDDRWGERPLAAIVRQEGSEITAEQLRDLLSSSLARWQLPERWTFIGEVPKTSVGKFDKKVLRKRYADGELEIEELTPPPAEK
ncbi:MAG: long-chain-fatty-acid--CoA ligase [Mycobacterium sp.]|nr:long-chain-fatty-acid--CoA ligase [Mycobacterium sp.]